MSLLDKQEVQDICEHTALRARKWSGFIYNYVNERQKIRHYRARSTEERRKKNAKSRFFTLRGAYVNCTIIALLAKKNRYKRVYSVGISNMRKSIYLFTTTPTSHTHRFHPHPPANHTHRFHPLSAIVIHTLNFASKYG